MNNRSSQRGSSLVAVLLTATVFAVALGATFSYLLNEQRLSASNRLYTEARLAAETVLEQGFAQLQRTFSRNASVTADGLNPFGTTSAPLTLGTSFQALYADGLIQSRIVPPPDPYVPANQTNYDTFVIAGRISPRTTFFIDPSIPGNENNPSAGTWVQMNAVDVYAKATVDDPQLGRRSSFVKQTFQIIDQSLFDYAVFYSASDLEIAPGPTMRWFGTGPIHSNYNIYAGAGDRLEFNVRVSTAGNFYARRHSDSGQGNQSGVIEIFNPASGDRVNLRVDGSYLDSDRDNFRQQSSEKFRGGLMTHEHGVHERYPAGIGELSALFDHTGNWEHHLIAPPSDLAALETDISLDDEKRHVLKTVEEQKFSTRSGLTVELVGTGTGQHVSIYTYKKDGTDFARDAQGNLIKVELDLPAGEEFWSVERYTATGNDENSANVQAGLYDRRQAEGSPNAADGRISLLAIDVGKLRELLETETDAWEAAESGDPLPPADWWNGGIYVRMPDASSTPPRNDRIVPSHPRWAVQLRNGLTLPNPSYARANQIFGMTLATNSALYIHGDYNAPDGKGTATNPGNLNNFAGEGHEVPAALVADAITVLSNNWDNLKSRQGLGSRKATDTVVSAAFITGNVPSGTVGSSNYSGGVENFPRFLEKWDNITLTYRGSMVMLFRSEVQKKRWGFDNVYSAPKRDWGYHSMFGQNYRPPLDIGPRVYQRFHFQELTEAQFNAEVDALITAYSPSSED